MNDLLYDAFFEGDYDKKIYFLETKDKDRNELILFNKLLELALSENDVLSEISEFYGDLDDYFNEAYSKTLKIYEKLKNKIDVLSILNIKENTEIDYPANDLSNSFEHIYNDYQTWIFLKNKNNFNLSFEEYRNINKKKIIFLTNFSSKIKINIGADDIDTINYLLDKNKSFNYKSSEEIENSLEKQLLMFNEHLLSKVIPASSNTVKKHFKNILDEELLMSFKKAKTLSSNMFVIEKLKNYYEEVFAILKDYYKYNHNIKEYSKLPKKDNNYFNILEETDLEKMNDFITKVKRESEIKKYQKSLLGSYQSKMDSESKLLIETMYEKKIPKEYAKNQLKKIASFENIETLNEVLDKILNSKEEKIEVLNKIENYNLNVNVIEKDNRLIIIVNDYKASQKLGSNSWCISTSEYHYNNYLKNDNMKHVFIYDFKKESTQNNHYIAITIDSENGIKNAFDKRDKNILKSIDETLDTETRNLVQSEVKKLTKEKNIKKIKLT